MAFFGLTQLGDPNIYLANQNQPDQFIFANIEDSEFKKTFLKYAIQDKALEESLQVDGSRTILRCKLMEVLKELLERIPTKQEYNLWSTCINQDCSGTLDIDDFMKGVADLKHISANPAELTTNKSYIAHSTGHFRHQRYQDDVQHKYNVPLTRAQDVGWNSLSKLPEVHRHALNSSDVTNGEGTRLVDYYGYYVMLGA